MKKYDNEFKKETVKKYLDGQSVASISREIGVNENEGYYYQIGGIQIWGILSPPEFEKQLKIKN